MCGQENDSIILEKCPAQRGQYTGGCFVKIITIALLFLSLSVPAFAQNQSEYSIAAIRDGFMIVGQKPYKMTGDCPRISGRRRNHVLRRPDNLRDRHGYRHREPLEVRADMRREPRHPRAQLTHSVRSTILPLPLCPTRGFGSNCPRRPAARSCFGAEPALVYHPSESLLLKQQWSPTRLC